MHIDRPLQVPALVVASVVVTLALSVVGAGYLGTRLVAWVDAAAPAPRAGTYEPMAWSASTTTAGAIQPSADWIEIDGLSVLWWIDTAGDIHHAPDIAFPLGGLTP